MDILFIHAEIAERHRQVRAAALAARAVRLNRVQSMEERVSPAGDFYNPPAALDVRDRALLRVYRHNHGSV